MSFTAEDYQAVLQEFAALGDKKYKKFNESLIPGTATAYGVRVPEVRRISRSIIKNDPAGYLVAAQPETFEEIMLRGMVIAGMKLPIAQRLALVEGFLPLIDNWAVCDTFCGSFKLKKPEEKAAVWDFILPLFQDRREFFARFAAVMFLGHFVEDDYVEQGLRQLEAMDQEAYYVRMAVAWAMSVCYVKFPGLTLPLIQRKALPPFTQNKAIQKIRESYRVPEEDKRMLLAYKVGK